MHWPRRSGKTPYRTMQGASYTRETRDVSIHSVHFSLLWLWWNRALKNVSSLGREWEREEREVHFATVYFLRKVCSFSLESLYHFYLLFLNINYLSSVQSRPRNILTQNEIIVESYWPKKRSYLNVEVIPGRRWAYKPKMSARNDCHFRLPAYEWFLGQAFHAIPGETGVQFRLSAYVALLIDSRFICLFCSFVFVSLWNDNKGWVYFLH